jgi:Short C-terminal domain
MFVRRRPLLRAAVVGGGAYVAGKKSAERSNQGARSGDQESGQSLSASPAAPAGGPSVPDQLAQLSQLHEQGALSDAEFAAAKSKLLGS